LKKNKTSKSWLIKQNRDPYFKQSKIKGYRSRSAFKLIEMNKKFKFLKKNTSLLDLGSSPGGWSQVASNEISNGKILAVDIISMEKIKNVDFINGDSFNNETNKKIKLYFEKIKPDVVISDMATNTTGNKDLDSFRTGELCINAMHLAKEILHENGCFLSKIFMGSIFTEINKIGKKSFKNVVMYKPPSSRKESKEVYIYCKGVLKI
jgi:23S rRNA (uridine2552-2'-O)-methyltransferase